MSESLRIGQSLINRGFYESSLILRDPAIVHVLLHEYLDDPRAFKPEIDIEIEDTGYQKFIVDIDYFISISDKLPISDDYKSIGDDIIECEDICVDIVFKTELIPFLIDLNQDTRDAFGEEDFRKLVRIGSRSVNDSVRALNSLTGNERIRLQE